MTIDADLRRRVFVFHPTGAPGSERSGGILSWPDEYGRPPFRFRPVRQNGSRVHLRLLTPDGLDARYPDDHEFLAGEFIERSAYSSDVRRGVYWTADEKTSAVRSSA